MWIPSAAPMISVIGRFAERRAWSAAIAACAFARSPPSSGPATRSCAACVRRPKWQRWREMNSFEMWRREEKALKLANLIGECLLVADVLQFGDDEWSMAAAAARVKKPSEATR